MPNYSVIQPIADTVDRRGQNYNSGVGDANTSAFGAAVEGFSSGMSNALDWNREIQQQRVDFSPEKLYAEQVNREQTARTLQLQADALEKKLPYTEQLIEADLAAKQATTALTKEQTRAADIKSDITEQFGEQRERLEIQKLQADIRKSRLDEAIKIFGKGGSASGLKPSDINTIRDNNVDTVNKEIASLNKEYQQNKDIWQILEWNQGQDTPEEYAEAAKKYDAWQKRKASALEDLRSIDTRYNELMYQQTGIDLTGNLSEQEGKITSAQSKQAAYAQQIQDYLATSDQAGMELEGEAGQYLAERAAYKSARDVAKLKATEKPYRDAIEATEDDGNIGAIEKANSLAQLLIAASDVPEGTPQEVVRDKIADVVDRAGGIDKMLEYGNNIEDEDRRAEWNRVVVAAAVKSGKQDQLQPIQQHILTMGLDEAAAADPEGTKKQISLALANKYDEITNLNVLGLSDHPLVSLASGVSDSGRDGFVISKPYATGDQGGQGVTADAYRVTNTRTGAVQDLAKTKVEGDPQSQDYARAKAQTDSVMAVLSSIGAENTEAAKKNVDTDHNIEAASATYQAGQPDPRVQQQRQTIARQPVQPQQPSEAQLTAEGFITGPNITTGVPPSPEMLTAIPEIAPSQVTTEGIAQGMLRYGAGYTTKTPSEQVTNKIKEVLTGISDGSYDAGPFGLEGREQYKVKEAAKLAATNIYDQLTEAELNLVYERKLPAYEAMAPAGRRGTPKEAAKRDIINSLENKIQQQLDSYATMLAGKVSSYYSREQIEKTNVEAARKSSLRRQSKAAEQQGDVLTATLRELQI